MRIRCWIVVIALGWASLGFTAEEGGEAALRSRVTTFFERIRDHRMRAFYIYERTGEFFTSREDHEDFLALFLETLDTHHFPEARVIDYEILDIEMLEEQDLEPRALVKVRLRGKGRWPFGKPETVETMIWFREEGTWYILPPRPETLRSYGIAPKDSDSRVP